MGNDEAASGSHEGQVPARKLVGNPAHPAPRCLRSEDLFSGHAEILIIHEGETYRLRVTRNGKLILQK